MEEKQGTFPMAGADEKTPSKAMYFSWINHAWEGANEPCTLASLDFFQWLHDEYGMTLDIYLLDAGTIDGLQIYGTIDSPGFHQRFPRGLKPMAEKARGFGCRLGMWMGPDGFGTTPEEEKARRDMIVAVARDHDMALFKFDGCCGNLRDDRSDSFARMMTEVRTHCPDLIALNHRINLDANALKHMTTWLWQGVETYIDVHIANSVTAPHNRAGAMSRGLPPQLSRLTEDHGVCLSSCLDYWEDDLVLQAFNRCLILAPEIYGNPWLLRDDEMPRLARLFNLHRRYRDILVNGIELPAGYGPNAVSRGDEATRLVTLTNLSWKAKAYTIELGGEIGLTDRRPVTVRLPFLPGDGDRQAHRRARRDRRGLRGRPRRSRPPGRAETPGPARHEGLHPPAQGRAAVRQGPPGRQERREDPRRRVDRRDIPGPGAQTAFPPQAGGPQEVARPRRRRGPLRGHLLRRR
ncbi:MAG: hypothetical protein NTV86_12055 [Planctomycetota bacterium]|nr:hypothetical protein [Planctomycetota bacterium]